VTRRAAILIVALALALTGCGETEFEKDYKPLNDDLLELAQRYGRALTAIPTNDPDQNGKAFGQLAQDTGELQQRFDELTPPDDLRSELDDLVSGLGDVQAALERIEKRAGEPAGLTTRASGLRILTPSVRKVDAAQEKLAEETGAGD
jgi:hypothetical protein